MANSETYPVVDFSPAPSRYMGVIGSASGSIEVPGISELGTGTASAHVLGAPPYLGARVDIAQGGTATDGISVVTNATGVAVNAKGNRTITFTGKGQFVSLIGVSATRWHVLGAGGVAFS